MDKRDDRSVRAYGLREPLPPKVASLYVKPRVCSGQQPEVTWSTVVALGSRAFPPRTALSAVDLEVTAPYSILLAIIQHEDILDSLLQNCPDFPTLFALVDSCNPTRYAFGRHSKGIINAVLKHMPQELRHLTVALIGINGSKIGDSSSIKKVMETWLGMELKPLTQRLLVCIPGSSPFLCSTPPRPTGL